MAVSRVDDLAAENPEAVDDLAAANREAVVDLVVAVQSQPLPPLSALYLAEAVVVAVVEEVAEAKLAVEAAATTPQVHRNEVAVDVEARGAEAVVDEASVEHLLALVRR